ncbi:hypothetical protein M514_25795 [Trichuris suis]|uniref:DDE-1 domain-containing protein n=2 Tax=Trichuris suis TaxID=68888 RepID=A0A085MXY0_9BILA|nr:hypothetical protein M514_25795 [Trichuris suis]
MDADIVVSLSYLMIKEKAVRLFDKLKQKALEDGDESTAKLTGESASADTEAAAKFQEELKNIIVECGYSYKQVFNCDETAIYWKKLSSKTFISREEKLAKGHKASKGRFTLMPVINATGDTTLRPLLVHHSEHPGALKHIDKSTLPVVFRSHPSGWNTQTIFFDYVTGYASPFVENYCKRNNVENRCFLIVYNCTANPPGVTEYGRNIRVMFLPPNITSLLQPCDQGFIAIIKAYYTQNVMRHIVNAIDRESNSRTSLREIWKNYNINMVIANLGDALDRLTVSVRNSIWGSLCPEGVEVPAILNPSTINEEIVALAKQAGFTEVDEHDAEKVLPSHEQEALEEELIELQEERIRTDAEHETERSEGEAIREMEKEHLREVLATIDSAAMLAERYDTNLERARLFRAGLEDVSRAYKELYIRRIREARQLDVTSFFKRSASTTADEEARQSSSTEADM